jgi:23S rRNA (uracil1939-C5)-methyltransferase
MALGHLEGKVVFVPLGAPGDRVEAAIVREKSRYAQARLLRVLEPSPDRREPPCPHFGVCGGCQWQHVSYGAQLAGKAESFRGFLESRLGSLAPGLFRPALAAPRQWGYRNRAGLKVRAAGGRVLLGYFARGTHRLVPIARCPILEPSLQAFLPKLGDFLQGFPPARGALPQVDLQVDGKGGLWTIFHLLREPTGKEREDLGRFAAAAGATGACLQRGRKHTLEPLGSEAEQRRMPFPLRAGGRDLALGVSTGGFAQANTAVNQALVDEVVSLRGLYGGRDALDLYCGAGNFTLPLALAARSVVGIEGYPPAAKDAAANAAANGLGNVRVFPSGADEGLRRLAAEGFRPEFALLDPPREGALEAIPLLADLAPAHILYVSCAPPTLARDLGLLRARGYRPEWIVPADMFPQTSHLESATLLRRG